MDSPACLLCSSSRARFWMTKAARAVHRCPDCRCIWVPDGLARNEEGVSIYEEEEPIFLKEASVFFDATGIEISKAAVDRSAELFGVKNYVGSIYEPPREARGPWDAVTLWDVIEHVPDPKGALEKIRDLLAPGGRLYLSTPDAGSAVARAMGRRWHYLDPVQHIVLFGRKNLKHLLEQTGFRVRDMRSFGHHYRVGYVLDRLAYLHGEGGLGRVVRPALATARSLEGRSVYINLRDVMGISAERV